VPEAEQQITLLGQQIVEALLGDEAFSGELFPGFERVLGQRRRSKWRVRPGQRLALPDLLSCELPRGQATGLYQGSSGLRSMANPKWLIAIGFNLYRLQTKWASDHPP
jgi:hypothetical protein